MRAFSLTGLARAILALSMIAFPARAARLYLDSRPTDNVPVDQCSDLIHRELPRQTLIVIANDELGVDVVDATLEPQAKPQPEDVQLGLDEELTKPPQVLKVKLFDGSNKQIEQFDIPCQLREPRFIKLDDLAAKLDDEESRSKWRTLLAKQLSVTTAKPTKWDPTLPTLEGIEARLNTIDFTSAYTSVQLIHAAIADSGASPARLGSLVRAYANLGESTRELISGQSSAMFARSYVYAQRLIRLAPQDPMSWYDRAYLEALHGMIPAGLADLKHGDELAKNAIPPTWVQLTNKLLIFDTPGLYRDSQAQGGPLASYLAWRTVEHSPLQALSINFAKLALQNNAGALRIVGAIGGNSGIGYIGMAASQAPQILNGLLAGMANSQEVPQAVREILLPAAETRFSTASSLTMLDALEKLPRESGQLMPWPAYAALIREWHFLNAVRTLAHSAYLVGPDATVGAKRIYPLVKDHRYSLVIATFDKTDQLAGADATDKLRHLPITDDTVSAMWTGLDLHLQRLGINNEPKRNQSWPTHASSQCDHTAFDLSAILWAYRNSESTPSMTQSRRTMAEELETTAPNHPDALAWRIMEDWPAMKDRAAAIERDYSDNPTIAYALGHAYVTLKQYDRAAPLLEKAIQYAPDKPVFQQLAEIYFAQANEDKWLATWDRYFQTNEDVGLDHASAASDIAMRLVYLRDNDKALEYANVAAQTGSQWGLEIYSAVLTRLRRYDEAHQAIRRTLGRYEPFSYYRWCRETGMGDLPAATAAMRAGVPQIDRRGDPTQLIDAATFFYLEGDIAKAMQYFDRSYHQHKDSYAAMFIALTKMEQKNTDEAKRYLDEAIAMPSDTPRLKAYKIGAVEMKRFIENPQSPPAKIGEMTRVITDSEMIVQRGNVSYMLGKLCEIEGKTEAAKIWYRVTLDTASPSFVGRGLAGNALRKLGEQYYK